MFAVIFDNKMCTVILCGCVQFSCAKRSNSVMRCEGLEALEVIVDVNESEIVNSRWGSKERMRHSVAIRKMA